MNVHHILELTRVSLDIDDLIQYALLDTFHTTRLLYSIQVVQKIFVYIIYFSHVLAYSIVEFMIVLKLTAPG